MGKKDPRVNAYIAKSAPFARPIITSSSKDLEAMVRRAAVLNEQGVTALEWIAEGKGRNWKYERKPAAPRQSAG